MRISLAAKLIVGTLFAFSDFLPPALASNVVPPPNPGASCASAEYAADKAGQQRETTSDASPGLLVVSGDSARHLNTSRRIEMGREVTVCVKGLYDWLYIKKRSPASLHLYVGGEILSGIPLASLAPPAQEYLNFALHMDAADDSDWKAWAAVLEASRRSSSQGKVTISIAQDKQVIESDAVTIVVPHPWYWKILVGIFVVLLAALMVLAAKTALLRSTVGIGTASPVSAPFSLGLVQMAFWFYLALVAYVYICVSTLQVHIPMGSVLGLLGISTTTGLAAVSIDSRKSSVAEKGKNDVLAEQAALKDRIKDLESVAPAGPLEEKELMDKRNRLAQVNAMFAQLPSGPSNPVSHGFVDDILSDGDGISFHRFQIVVWTLTLGFVFVWDVYRSMAMPEFDPSLLTLMGISSGTYVGFKFPEAPKS